VSDLRRATELYQSIGWQPVPGAADAVFFHRDHRRAGPMRRLVLLIASVGWLLPACGDGADDVAPAPTTTIGATTITVTTVDRTTPTTVVATTTTTPGGRATAPVTLRCTSIGFTPNSEDVASDITATGLPCAEAEAFVRVAGAQTSSGGPEEVDVSGYHCVLTQSEQDPLPQASYRCVDGPKTVTFVRT
jgi:hypothetical protein